MGAGEAFRSHLMEAVSVGPRLHSRRWQMILLFARREELT